MWFLLFFLKNDSTKQDMAYALLFERFEDYNVCFGLAFFTPIP